MEEGVTEQVTDKVGLHRTRLRLTATQPAPGDPHQGAGNGGGLRRAAQLADRAVEAPAGLPNLVSFAIG
jgi:hypothetical protein